MGDSARFSYGEEEQFQCECKSQLTMNITKQDGHNEIETFYCPRCAKEYKFRASTSIANIRIIPPLSTNPLERKMEISMLQNSLERKAEDLSVEIAQMDQRRETFTDDEDRYLDLKSKECEEAQAQIDRLKAMFNRA